MERVDSMSDDPSLDGSSDSGELSPRPTARLEDFLFDPTGEIRRRRGLGTEASVGTAACCTTTRGIAVVIHWPLLAQVQPPLSCFTCRL